MANQTLNQVVQTIQGLAEAHQQINTVYFGNLVDFLSKGSDNVYPAMFFDLTSSNINGTVQTMNFSLYFMDRMLAEQSNETEVLSDQLSIAQDIVAQLRYDGFLFTVDDSVPLTFFTEDTPDLLAGVKADISIDLDFSANRCQVPTDYIFPVYETVIENGTPIPVEVATTAWVTANYQKKISIGNNPPANPSVNDLWINTAI